MKRRPLLLLTALTGLACVGFGRDNDERQKADLIKLDDPKLREAEVARLAECDGKQRKLVAWRFHRCPQRDGKADLHVLAVDYEYDYEARSSIEKAYEITTRETLFGKDPGVGGLLEPSPACLHDHSMMVFGSDGNELRPFGNDTHLARGYLFDFNRDGILDRATSNNKDVKEADDQDIDVFELATIEREPKLLLQVIFNWHSEDADEIDEWDFTCYDEEGDGRLEIAFGPKIAATDADLRRFVFRWDDTTKRYSAGEIPENSHIRVMQPGETLEQIAQNGGLGYPIESGSSDDPFASKAPSKGAAQKPYVFQSLKGASDAELLSFCRGKERRNFFDGPPGAVETGLPPGFWEMSPKEAALTFAEANRTPIHRRKWKLAMDDRNGIAPPKSGWWLHSGSSSGCYSFSAHNFALRFGVETPVLLATDFNTQGAVDRNPLVDQPGSTARLIPLSENEARFIADTLFWLDRIRSHTPEKTNGGWISSGSTADGFGTLRLIGDGDPPQKIDSTTIWAIGSISSQWKYDYTPQICINLAEHFFTEALPARLGERWLVAPEIDRRSVMTPIEKRLEPRHDITARDQLGEVIRRAFELHFKDPIPAPALEDLVNNIGQEGFLELQPALEKLKASLPPEGAEDREFEALDKRFSYGLRGEQRDDPSEHPKDYERYSALEEKRELKPGPVLRKPVDSALEQLRLAVSSKLLMKEVEAKGEHTGWALDRLRRNFPELWKDHLIGEFQDANLDGKRLIFHTLAVASPRAAKDLVALISPKDINDLLIEVTKFQLKHDPGTVPARVPALIEMVRERKEDYRRRGEAMSLLGEFKLESDQIKSLMPLLLAEVKNPQKGEYAGSDTFSEAIGALSRLPGGAAHLDQIIRAAGGQSGYSGFESGVDALWRLTEGATDRMARLESFVHPCLKQHDGMMDDVFLAALALDLRGLAPEIAAMASESPAVADGDGAHSAGGDFKGPAGQRYHLAREITALWNETDPATRSRLWIAMIVSRPHYFKPGRESEHGKCLIKQAAGAIGELPEETRKKSIEAMIAAAPELPYYSETTDWLRGLAEK
jgi:hypothetical protein